VAEFIGHGKSVSYETLNKLRLITKPIKILGLLGDAEGILNHNLFFKCKFKNSLVLVYSGDFLDYNRLLSSLINEEVNMNSMAAKPEETKEASSKPHNDSDNDLINLNAVWTLVVILAGIMIAVYLAVIGNQVEFL